MTLQPTELPGQGWFRDFDKCTQLCRHHPTEDTELLYHLRNFLHASLQSVSALSGEISFTSDGISYKWNHTIYILLRQAFFPYLNIVRFIPVVLCFSIICFVLVFNKLFLKTVLDL